MKEIRPRELPVLWMRSGIFREKGCYTGMAVQNKSLKENIDESEMQLIMLVA